MKHFNNSNFPPTEKLLMVEQEDLDLLELDNLTKVDIILIPKDLLPQLKASMLFESLHQILKLKGKVLTFEQVLLW